MNARLHCLFFACTLSLLATAASRGAQIVSEFSGHKIPDQETPLPPAESVKLFTVPDDLEIELVLSEPEIAQPLHLSFDERGRMWVVEYRQYPAPAGLTVVSRDNYWRAVYDKVPEPPPRGARGLDRITIHEDTNGDGRYDKHTTFVDGLNIATSCARGRGGVWVLNPPYLLFYPDANNDDVPDGPPAVHLSGFGMEDTHSVVNSLCWGPDGWLYAAQGSTVSARVRVADSTNEVFSQGQNIWRYHPETKRYEIFSEGGGNAFGVEFDAQGRIFSGHNGGDTRGFHYMQGAYLQKGFTKHGPLSNPYAFGYFPQMSGTKGERFTHNFIIYESGALPSRYTGKLFGVEPLQGRVVLSDITPDGTTFRTKDLERVVTSKDSWFRPVDIKAGPDGAIYIADWYDRQVTHTRNQEGHIDRTNGRIYRLKAKGAQPIKPLDLSKQTSAALAKQLTSTNKWVRQTTQRLIGDSRATTDIPALLGMLSRGPAQSSLEALWALHLSNRNAPGSPIRSSLTKYLAHADPQVRLWTVRLTGDEPQISRDQAKALHDLAAREPSLEVRAQLACTAKRLPVAESLALFSTLAARDEDAKDARQPLLLWWALEVHCGANRSAVLNLFQDSTLWRQPLVEQHILALLMRRFAATGVRDDLLICAKLLNLAPDQQRAAKLMEGFEEAFQGRSLAGLPQEFVNAVAKQQVGSDAFKLRAGDSAMLDTAIKTIVDTKAKRQRRLEFIAVLGEMRATNALPALLAVADDERDIELRKAAIGALAGLDDPRISAVVLKDFHAQTNELRAAALSLLASRANWSLELAKAVEQKRITPGEVATDIVRQMQRHKNAELAKLIPQLWPNLARPTTAQMEQQIQRLAKVIRTGTGNPYEGKKLFTSTCGSCHKLFTQGGEIGPDLTTYHRADLDTLLLNIINPSAEIREGYESLAVETKDERSFTGFLIGKDEQVVVLRGLNGANTTLARDEIAEMKSAGMSLMPEGLLDGFTEQQVRDLFAYLRSTQPLNN